MDIRHSDAESSFAQTTHRGVPKASCLAFPHVDWEDHQGRLLRDASYRDNPVRAAAHQVPPGHGV
jgi:hypothetical protein